MVLILLSSISHHRDDATMRLCVVALWSCKAIACSFYPRPVGMML